MAKKLERLDDRERAILVYRFGLNGETPLTLKEVGKRLGVTREWVRKIEIRALQKLGEDDLSKVVPAKTRPRRVKPADETAPVKVISAKTKPSPATSRQETAIGTSTRFQTRDGLASFRRRKSVQRHEAVSNFS